MQCVFLLHQAPVFFLRSSARWVFFPEVSCLSSSPLLTPLHIPPHMLSQEHTTHFFHVKMYFGKSFRICIYKFSLFFLMTISFPLYKYHNLLSVSYRGISCCFHFLAVQVQQMFLHLSLYTCRILKLGLI